MFCVLIVKRFANTKWRSADQSTPCIKPRDLEGESR